MRGTTRRAGSREASEEVHKWWEKNKGGTRESERRHVAAKDRKAETDEGRGRADQKGRKDGEGEREKGHIPALLPLPLSHLVRYETSSVERTSSLVLVVPRRELESR